MPTPPKETAAPAPVIERDTSTDLTLQEYCQRKSMGGNQVELLGGFHASEVAAGHHKDAEATFEARFQAFSTKPA